MMIYKYNYNFTNLDDAKIKINEMEIEDGFTPTPTDSNNWKLYHTFDSTSNKYISALRVDREKVD